MAYDIFRGEVSGNFSRGEASREEVGLALPFQSSGQSPWKLPALIVLGALGFSLVSMKLER